MKRLTALLSALIATLSTRAFAEYGLNMTEGVTSVSRDIYDLHMVIFWVCVAIAVVVFGAMFYSIFAHRKSIGHKAANFHENTKAEFLWTGVPILILIAMAIPASEVLNSSILLWPYPYQQTHPHKHGKRPCNVLLPEW